ncbi:hypothetical protein BAOM_0924 [Peribacillus asahii]|uniref:Uncharacterized protein n=1 Tax=Peribacillus asahii TaxID=228899 RepID=A0A3Q9RKA7_9BACI|nr:hypothetical protein [Peribacillus asahii]AZV41535.1 hypothetical protein BAOM_0924 [Peribacillus asahii]
MFGFRRKLTEKEEKERKKKILRKMLKHSQKFGPIKKIRIHYNKPDENE